MQNERSEKRPPDRTIDPRFLKVLVVDNKEQSRRQTLSLLHECSYQATGVQTGAEALRLLREAEGVDLIVKSHEPPNSNAANFLKQIQRDPLLRAIPVVVVSSYDNRDVVLKCLSLGASDYWIKPLRANEVRNLWTRVWLRKGAAGGAAAPRLPDISSEEASEYTKNGSAEEQEPTSKEGSAPDGALQRLNPGGAAHASGNGSSGIAGAQLGAPDGSGNGNGSSGNGEKGHVGSNTGGGSGEATGHRSNGGHGTAGGSGQLGSGNGASAVANGNSNDGGANNHVGSNFGNGNGSNGNGNGNHVGSNFGSGNGTGSNGNGMATNGQCMPYDASTTAKPAGPPHHHHAHHPHLPHHGQHTHHGHAHGRHHHGSGAGGSGSQAPAGGGGGAGAQKPPMPGDPKFHSPPPRPRMAELSPDVRPLFSTFGMAERYPSGITAGGGGSSGNGGTSAPPAEPRMGMGMGEEARRDLQAPTGFTAWANLHSSQGQEGPLPNEVAEVAEALTSLRDSGGDSPGGSRAAGDGSGGGSGSGGRDGRQSASQPQPAAGAQQAQQQQHGSHVVKPVPIKFSRTTISDDTRLPQSRGPVAGANPRAPGGSAPPTLMTWSDPGRAPGQCQGPAAHFPCGPGHLPPQPLVAMRQHPQHSSMGTAPPLLPPPPQQQAPHGSLFGPFPPPPYGPLPPFMPPPLGFPWGGPGMGPQPQLDPAQMAGLGSQGAGAFQFPFTVPPGPFMQQGHQEMAAMQQALMVHQQQGYHQQFMLPYQPGMPAPHGFPAAPWARPPGPPWGPGPPAVAAAAAASGAAGGAAMPLLPPPAMLAAAAAAGGLATTPLVMPSQSLAALNRAASVLHPGAASLGAHTAHTALGGAGVTATATAVEGAKSVMGAEAQSKREARQQALSKYKEKRKNLNASNKIRYQARKVLAESRPRVKGQFVKVFAKDGGAEQGSNGGALTTAASPHVTCDGEGPSGAHDGGGGAAVVGPALGPPAAGEVVQPMERDVYEDEGLEYDAQEEDLGDEEEEEGAGRSRAGTGGGGRGGSGLQRMAVDAPAVGHGAARCRLQADESESATQSITDPHQQGPLTLHVHMHPSAAAGGGGGGAVATPTSAAAGGAKPMDLSLPPGTHAPQHHHKPAGHITGQKHKRDSGRDAANRNGSDSGSNSPGDQTPSGPGRQGP